MKANLILVLAVALCCGVVTAGESAREKLARLVNNYNSECDGHERAKIVNRMGKIKTSETCGELSRVMARIASEDCDQRVAAEALDELGDDGRRDRDRGYVANAVQQGACLPGAFGAAAGGRQRPLGTKAEKQRRQLANSLSR